MNTSAKAKTTGKYSTKNWLFKPWEPGHSTTIAVIRTRSIRLATVTTARLSGLPITYRPWRKKFIAIRARKNGMVWVRWLIDVDVHNTSAIPAAITLQRAQRMTVWPKNTSSWSAWAEVRISRTFDI